jgi:hypothetical protein
VPGDQEQTPEFVLGVLVDQGNDDRLGLRLGQGLETAPGFVSQIGQRVRWRA